MAADKFTAEDRKLLLDELERIQQSKLKAIDTSKKLLIDEKGMLYFLFGGKGDWHGIRPNVINKLREYNKEGAFVIAKKYKTKIDVCVGSLANLISSIEKLVKN